MRFKVIFSYFVSRGQPGLESGPLSHVPLEVTYSNCLPPTSQDMKHDGTQTVGWPSSLLRWSVNVKLNKEP